MRSLLILISFFLLLSCSTRVTDLQAVKNNTRIDTNLDSMKLVQMKKSDNNLVLSFSNGQYQYWAEITPGDEPISFSPEKGFSGKAKNIKIFGNDDRSTTNLTSKHAESDSTNKTEVKQRSTIKTEDKSKERHIETKRPAWQSALMVVAMFAIVIGALYLFLRHKAKPTIDLNEKN